MHFADQGRVDEIKRLNALERIAQKDFYPFTKLATVVCDVPIAFISVLDHEKEHFLVRIGLDKISLGKDKSICGHTIEQDNVFIINNIPADKRFLDFPKAIGMPDLKFYAGAPLITSNNIKVGVLCVMDSAERSVSKDQEISLELLASQVISKLEDELMKHELKFAVARLEALLNGIGLAIIFEDERKSIFAINQTSHEIFGSKIDSFIDDNVVESLFKLSFIFKNPDDFMRKVSEYSASLVEVGGYEVETCDGRHVEVSRFPIVVEHDVKGYLWIFKDISERTEVERQIEMHKAQLIMASKMVSLGEVAAGIAHEINNPLSIIQSVAYILKRATDENTTSLEKVREAGERIEQTGNRIARIIKGILQFARESERDQSVEVLMQDILEETFGFVEARFKHFGIPLRVISFDAKLTVLCSRSSFSQILINLLNNAIDAASAVDEKWVEIEVTDANTFVKIAVTDSGNGIPENIRSKVMQPFFTTKEVGKGSGLGLSISKGLAEDMGGRLSLDNHREHTTFVLELLKGSATASEEPSEGLNAAKASGL